MGKIKEHFKTRKGFYIGVCVGVVVLAGITYLIVRGNSQASHTVLDSVGSDCPAKESMDAFTFFQ